jgi:hypothetical protein
MRHLQILPGDRVKCLVKSSSFYQMVGDVVRVGPSAIGTTIAWVEFGSHYETVRFYEDEIKVVRKGPFHATR